MSAFAATESPQECSRGLQQARQVAKDSSYQLQNDAFVLGTLVAKRTKRLEATNSAAEADDPRAE